MQSTVQSASKSKPFSSWNKTKRLNRQSTDPLLGLYYLLDSRLPKIDINPHNNDIFKQNVNIRITPCTLPASNVNRTTSAPRLFFRSSNHSTSWLTIDESIARLKPNPIWKCEIFCFLKYVYFYRILRVRLPPALMK